MNRHIKRLQLLLFLPLLILGCNSDEDNGIRYTGIVDANTVRVSAETQGRIISLHFDEGDKVDSGSVLLAVESDKLGFQLSAQEAGISEVSNNYQAAARELDAAVIQRDNLKQKYGRLENLLKSKAVTQQQVDDVKTQLDAANTRLEAARSSLAAMRNKKQQMESTIKVTKDQIAKSYTSSPLKGTVLVRYVENGELVMPGLPICEIANINEVWTKIYISETDLPETKLGQKVTVYIDGKTDTPLEGTISWISDESEFTPKTILTEETRTTLVYAAKVRIPNNEGLLKIGMPISVVVKGYK